MFKAHTKIFFQSSCITISFVQRFIIMTTYRVCMYVCMYVCMHACMHVNVHVYMYACMFVIFVCICKSFILQTPVTKLFPWQHIRIHSGHFVHIVFYLYFSSHHGTIGYNITQEKYMRF